MTSRVAAYAFAFLVLATLCPVDAANPGDTCVHCSARHIALCPIDDRPGLPRVLLIGDSVSIGYTLEVRQRLADVANVHRIPRNGGSTSFGLKSLDQWLGSERWDVIHVNFGLHDAQLASSGASKTDLATYAKNVKAIILRLKSAASHVVWATSTPIPADVEATDYKGIDIAPYNRVAVQVAREEGVAVDDLYGVVLPQEAQLQRSGNVHFTSHGYDVLANAVAASITAQLHVK